MTPTRVYYQSMFAELRKISDATKRADAEEKQIQRLIREYFNVPEPQRLLHD